MLKKRHLKLVHSQDTVLDPKDPTCSDGYICCQSIVVRGEVSYKIWFLYEKSLPYDSYKAFLRLINARYAKFEGVTPGQAFKMTVEKQPGKAFKGDEIKQPELSVFLEAPVTKRKRKVCLRIFRECLRLAGICRLPIVSKVPASKNKRSSV